MLVNEVPRSRPKPIMARYIIKSNRTARMERLKRVNRAPLDYVMDLAARRKEDGEGPEG